ncbi:MAG: hypothetical protein Kow0025_00940 [Thermodesulfovibrionales bacterium]
MAKKIKIRSSRGQEFSSTLLLGGQEYLVVTEDKGGDEVKVVTRVYLKGRILSTTEKAYGKRTAAQNTEEAMRKQHLMVVSSLGAEAAKADKPPSESLDEAKVLLRKRDHRGALAVLREALSRHPEDPFILSYYGCLTSIVEGNHDEGIKSCKSAIRSLEARVPFGQEFFYPSFYLNLGRASIAAGRRRDAIMAFQKGLRADSENREIIEELKRLGVRRKPVASFLKRSHPINKYMGLLLHRLDSGGKPSN